MLQLCFVVGVVVRNRILRIFESRKQEVKLGGSAGKATGYRLDDQGLIPSRNKRFFYSIASRPALRPTQPPVQSLPRALGHQGVKLVNHLHLVLMSRMVEPYFYSPCIFMV
jgi:hypothetical protein